MDQQKNDLTCLVGKMVHWQWAAASGAGVVSGYYEKDTVIYMLVRDAVAGAVSHVPVFYLTRIP